MSKLLVIFGSTGQQGNSVIQAVLDDAILSREYKLRGLTRNPASDAAQALSKQGVEVAQCDTSDAESVKAALKGAHSIFAMDPTNYSANGKETEIAQGKAIADIAVAEGAQFFIWSSSTHVSRVSGGKIKHGDIFEAKAIVQDYIATLPIKSSFYVPANFYQNYLGEPYKPRPNGDGTFGIANVLKPEDKMPFIDITNTGKFVAAMLAEPDKYAGKSVIAATEFRTMPELCEVLSKASGKTVKFAQVPDEVYKSFMPEFIADRGLDIFVYIREYGYYGRPNEQAEAEAQWAKENARGTLTTLEEFFKANRLVLE